MGKLRISKRVGLKPFYIKKTVSFKVGGTSFRIGTKGMSTSTKICKGVRYTTYIPYENKKTDNKVVKKINNENIKNKKANKEIKKSKHSYREFYKIVTCRLYTDNEKMNLILEIGKSGLTVEERVKLISLIKTK